MSVHDSRCRLYGAARLLCRFGGGVPRLAAVTGARAPVVERITHSAGPAASVRDVNATNLQHPPTLEPRFRPSPDCCPMHVPLRLP